MSSTRKTQERANSCLVPVIQKAIKGWALHVVLTSFAAALRGYAEDMNLDADSDADLVADLLDALAIQKEEKSHAR